MPFDNSTGYNDYAANTSHTFWYTCGSGSNRLLLVYVACTSAAISGVTYNGDSMSLCSGEIYSYRRLFRLVNPASGTHDIVVTLGSSEDIRLVTAASYYDVDQTTPVENTAETEGTPAATVSSQAGDTVFLVLYDSAVTTGTVSAPASERLDTRPGGYTTYVADAPGGASVTITVTPATSYDYPKIYAGNINAAASSSAPSGTTRPRILTPFATARQRF